MSLLEISVVLLSAFGVFFMLVSAIGIVRLPDVFSRMHAGGKASTVGISAMLLAAGFYFFEEFLFYRMILLIALLLRRFRSPPPPCRAPPIVPGR